MSNEQAIKELKRLIEIYNYTDTTELALSKAIEALEKQIPIEPKWEGEPMGVKGLNFDNMYCPICDYIFKEDYDYCPDCGQKIAWEG